MKRGLLGTAGVAAAVALLAAGSPALAGTGGCPGGDDYCLGPQVTIKKAPKPATESRRAVFKFTSSDPSARFRCSLDGDPFERCKSPKRYRRLDGGRHVFRVQAVSKAGVPGKAVRHKWRVTSPGLACGNAKGGCTPPQPGSRG